jgi:DNA-binding NarL/FixJ family response regulator
LNTVTTMPGIICVIVAEDNDDLRTVMPPLINEESDLHCAAATAYLDEVASLIELHQAHVAVLDIELRGGSSLQRLAALRQQFPATRFVIHSGHSNPALIRTARETGADGYVLKSGDIDDLLNEIRRVVRAAGGPAENP